MSKDQRKTLGEKIAAANDPLRGKELAAAQREDHLRALKEELAGYQAVGKDDRAKAVEAEIRRVEKEPVGRKADEPDSTAEQSGPDETGAESAAKKTAASRRSGRARG